MIHQTSQHIVQRNYQDKIKKSLNDDKTLSKKIFQHKWILSFKVGYLCGYDFNYSRWITKTL